MKPRRGGAQVFTIHSDFCFLSSYRFLIKNMTCHIDSKYSKDHSTLLVVTFWLRTMTACHIRPSQSQNARFQPPPEARTPDFNPIPKSECLFSTPEARTPDFNPLPKPERLISTPPQARSPKFEA